jgi:hypothetical protein
VKNLASAIHKHLFFHRVSYNVMKLSSKGIAEIGNRKFQLTAPGIDCTLLVFVLLNCLLIESLEIEHILLKLHKNRRDASHTRWKTLVRDDVANHLISRTLYNIDEPNSKDSSDSDGKTTSVRAVTRKNKEIDTRPVCVDTLPGLFLILLIVFPMYCATLFYVCVN